MTWHGRGALWHRRGVAWHSALQRERKNERSVMRSSFFKKSARCMHAELPTYDFYDVIVLQTCGGFLAFFFVQSDKIMPYNCSFVDTYASTNCKRGH